MKLLILFIVMNVLNVIVQTAKSLATIKCGKMGAAIVNAVAYGLYTYIVILTMCNIPLIWKCIIVALANFVGVYIVKWVEEKARKDKLWRVEMTVNTKLADKMHNELNYFGISHYWINAGKHTVLNVFCPTQKESAFVKHLADKHHAKYFVSESKTL